MDAVWVVCIQQQYVLPSQAYTTLEWLVVIAKVMYGSLWFYTTLEHLATKKIMVISPDWPCT